MKRVAVITAAAVAVLLLWAAGVAASAAVTMERMDTTVPSPPGSLSPTLDTDIFRARSLNTTFMNAQTADMQSLDVFLLEMKNLHQDYHEWVATIKAFKDMLTIEAPDGTVLCIGGGVATICDGPEVRPTPEPGPDIRALITGRAGNRRIP